MMFKIFSGGEPAEAAGSREMMNDFGTRSHALSPVLGALFNIGRGPVFALVLLGLSGCVCAPAKPWPQINLKAPGWTVRQGQALWRLPHGTREIAGDLVVADRTDGEAFVQFSKEPFPLVVAQSTAHRWKVEFPPQNKHYSGRGAPPKRLIWLYLPRVLAGQPPPAHWTWHRDNSGWQLKNDTTGESLEGYFNQ